MYWYGVIMFSLYLLGTIIDVLHNKGTVGERFVGIVFQVAMLIYLFNTIGHVL